MIRRPLALSPAGGGVDVIKRFLQNRVSEASVTSTRERDEGSRVRVFFTILKSGAKMGEEEMRGVHANMQGKASLQWKVFEEEGGRSEPCPARERRVVVVVWFWCRWQR